MLDIRPRTRSPKGDPLSGSLRGELGAYERTGLAQHPLSKRSVYRYRGVLLAYQQALDGRKPSVPLTKQYLGDLRTRGLSESSVYVHRAVLLGFHQWREEHFTFAVRKPKRQPKYVEPALVDRMLALSEAVPLDHLMIRLMADAGLRREEVVNLRVRDVGEKALRFAGKRGRERTVPLAAELKTAIQPFLAGKANRDRVVGMGGKAIYLRVRKYAKAAGNSEIRPHDLRHHFCERLVEAGVPVRVVQELAGHESLETTQAYLGVTGEHLEQAIRQMESAKTKPAVGLTIDWRTDRPGPGRGSESTWPGV